MAWEHFTDWLEPGQIITKAQRDELLDAIEERIKAIDGRWGWSAEMANIKASGVHTLRVHIKGFALAPGASAEDELDNVIFGLSESHYIKGDDPTASIDRWNSFEIFYQAAEDLGYIVDAADPADQSIVDQIMESSRFYTADKAKFWNLMRRSVQLLQIPLLNLYGPVSYKKQVEDPGSIEEVQAATEELDASAPSQLAGWLNDNGALYRFTVKANLDAVLYDSRELWAGTDTFREFGGGSYRWTLGAGSPSTFTYPASPSSPYYQLMVESLGLVEGDGELVISVDTPNYYVGGPTDDPSMVRVQWISDAGVYGAPIFTHPLEAIP